MPTPLLQLYTQTHYLTDGATTVWNFAFTDGYLSKSYVKAYWLSPGGVRTDLTVVTGDFVGAFQLRIAPAIAAGNKLVIYRDTPKDAPLVNFATPAALDEANLDTVTRQCIHVVAEILDGSGSQFVLSELGFKNFKRTVYTGPSTVLLADSGMAHFKTDGSSVMVPNTLPDEFITTIFNESSSQMSVTFDQGVCYQQASGVPAPLATLLVYPHGTLTITKVAAGVWYGSGSIVL